MATRVNDLSNLLNSLTGLTPVFAGSGKTTSTQTSLDQGSIASLQNTLSGGGFSKASAQNDSKAAIDNILRKMLEAGTPQIAGAQKGAGIYNDTTSSLLSNDLMARVAEQGAALEQQTVKDYAAIQNQAAQNLKGAAITKTTQTGAAIEDPIMAALKTAGIGLGASLASNAFSSIFSNDTKKRKDQDYVFGASGGSSGFDVPQFSPSFDSNIASLQFGTDSGFADSGVNLPNFGASSAFGSSTAGSDSGFDFGGLLGAVASPIIESLGGTLNSDGNGGFTGGWDLGCFITTAVCKASGLPDNCKELVTLREFRDSYMQGTPERKERVLQYYEEAPKIVEAMEGLNSAYKASMYAHFLTSYIQPAISAIELGEFEVAYTIYSALFEFAKELTGE